jgi:hypothetical protein
MSAGGYKLVTFDFVEKKWQKNKKRTGVKELCWFLSVGKWTSRYIELQSH